MKNLTIEITDKCSLNCIHCSTNAGKEKNLFLTQKEIESALHEFSDFEKVRLSGGEPFEHPNFIEIAKMIKEKGRYLEILSSGVYDCKAVPLKLFKQMQPHVDNIVFSIYGGKEIHDEICNSPAYNLLTKSVQSTIEQKIPFSFETVSMDSTLNALEDIVKYLNNIKSKINYCDPRLHVLRFIKQGRGEINHNRSANEREIESIIELGKELERNYDIKITFGRAFTKRDCVAGEGKAAITIYGERILCSALKYGARQEKFACSERW